MAVAVPLGAPHGAVGVAPMAVAVPSAQGWPDLASHDEKVRRLFDEFDQRQVRHLELELWIAAYRRLNVGFSSATVNDLFEKADADRNRVLSFAEFQRFGEFYPTLLDCLYYRAKDFHTDILHREGVEAAKARLTELRDDEVRLRNAYAQAQADTESADHRAQVQHAAVCDAQAYEQSAKSGLDSAHDDTERGRGDLRERTGELNRCKEAERARQQEVHDAQRQVEMGARRLHLQDVEVAKAEERLREIERMYIEQQHEVERQRAGSTRCRGELSQCQAREQEALAADAEMRRETHLSADRVAVAEAEVQHRQERERVAGQQLREAAAEVARRISALDAAQRELGAARDAESARKVDDQAASVGVDQHEHALAALEQEALDFVARRRAVDDEELPLLEQEVRLREQRESLESKEHRLREDFHSFAGRATGGGLSRPPSPRQSVHRRHLVDARSTSPAGSIVLQPSRVAPAPVAAPHLSPRPRVAIGGVLPPDLPPAAVPPHPPAGYQHPAGGGFVVATRELLRDPGPPAPLFAAPPPLPVPGRASPTWRGQSPGSRAAY